MINKQYRPVFIAVIIICCILLGVGRFFDLQIAEYLYNPKSVVGIIFEAFSSLPVYFFIPVLGACFMVRNNDSTLVFTGGALMLICFCCYYMFSSFGTLRDRGLIKRANPFLCGALGGLSAAVILHFMRKLSSRKVKKVQAMCAFGAAYFVCYLVIFTGLKIVCGRDRYDDIVNGGDYAFAKWYLPDFFSEGSSFPSGHVGAAMGVLTLLLLPFLFDYFRKKKILIAVLCYLYVAFTAFTRLVMGRHFLSDVAMSILLMTVIFMVLTPFFEKTFSPLMRKKKRRRADVPRNTGVLE